MHQLAEILYGWDRRALASELVQLGLEFAPESGELLADALLFGPPVSDAQFSLAVFQLIERAPAEANRLAVALAQRGQHARAVEVLEPLAERIGRSAALWSNLAVAYDEVGRREDARLAVGRALSIDPRDPSALRMLELFAEDD